MTVDDETLSAFADGELPPKKAAEVAMAVATDAGLAVRLQRFRAVRALVGVEAAPTPKARLLGFARRAWIPALTGIAGLAVGLGAVLLRREIPLVDLRAGMAARGALEAALDETAGGMSFAQGGATVSPLYTVVAADGRPCRTFHVEAQTAFEGAACREGGAWRLLTLAPVAVRAPGFDQASVSEPPALAAAMEDLEASDPLARDAEAELMAAGWVPVRR